MPFSLSQFFQCLARFSNEFRHKTTTMKTLFAILACSLGLLAGAQSLDFGLKGGLNFGSTGELSDVSAVMSNVLQDNADEKVGYHLGVYAQVGEKFYVRPELLYTRLNAEYEVAPGASIDYNVTKLDLPVLLGLRVAGPVSVFAGPSLQYIVDGELEDLDYDEVRNEFSVGLQAGVAFQLKSVRLDLRYERGLNENETEFLNSRFSYNVDSRPEQLILALSFSLL